MGHLLPKIGDSALQFLIEVHENYLLTNKIVKKEILLDGFIFW